MQDSSVRILKQADNVSEFGGKAVNLAKILQAGLPVPGGFAVGLHSFTENGVLHESSKGDIQKLLQPDKQYAVRSSAVAEDAEGASWAGQFETFLNTPSGKVLEQIENCHNSAKTRARAYASDKSQKEGFEIAVVVQEMIQPQFAGVLFTKDPLTGKDMLVTEYVEGLGEDLVSGQADPTRITWKAGEDISAPFPIQRLTILAQEVSKLFGSPQDIEWAWSDNTMWLVQARSITAMQASQSSYYLGEPNELFYWGPSRAHPYFMSDFMTAVENFFMELHERTDVPKPPKTLVLFYDKKMVWLNNAHEFEIFVTKMFTTYESQKVFEQDRSNWKTAAMKLKEYSGKKFEQTLLQAWRSTLFAEFALYGAASALTKRLERFDSKDLQEILGGFTVPDSITFLAQIDNELLAAKDPKALAEKYFWINDGYFGVTNNAREYFSERLKLLMEDSQNVVEVKKDRDTLAKKFQLNKEEIATLTLARNLAEFMDERKAWMMQTRHLLTKQIGNIMHGWFFDENQGKLLAKVQTQELWERYVHFKASSSAVKGIVASNGGRHFVHGEVAIALSPTDNVGGDKIIVVPATSPSYIPLMRKAKALITDHGGMMSHAAIVGREFNLPCIVGTKIGTKVLKNGDQVVLDMVTGEVHR